LAALDANILHRRAIGAQPVGDDRLGPAEALHRSLQEAKRCLTVPLFRSIDLQHLAFMIDGAVRQMRSSLSLPEDTGIQAVQS
jgi:hypothetical protein